MKENQIAIIIPARYGSSRLEGKPLLKANNVILTPHMGFSSLESMEKRADIVFDNLFSFLEGNLKNRV